MKYAWSRMQNIPCTDIFRTMFKGLITLHKKECYGLQYPQVFNICSVTCELKKKRLLGLVMLSLLKV